MKGKNRLLLEILVHSYKVTKFSLAILCVLSVTGTLIRRHRIPRPAPYDDEFYTVEDFNIGKDINLYSRTFKITGCDEFTQNFLRKLGVKLNQPQDTPSDPYMSHRQAVGLILQWWLLIVLY